MKLIELRTGVNVPEPVYLTTMTTLHVLVAHAETNIIDAMLVWDLHELARYPDHPVGEEQRQRMIDLSLADSAGRLHTDVAHIVRAAFEGDVDVRLVDPVFRS